MTLVGVGADDPLPAYESEMLVTGPPLRVRLKAELTDAGVACPAAPERVLVTKVPAFKV